MRLSKVTGIFVAVAMLMAGAATAHADLCKNVRFKFTNKHQLGRDVSVDKIMYWDKSDKKWRTEDVQPDTVCGFGKTCITDEEDLEHVENEVIEKIRFVYKEWIPKSAGGGEGNWSANIEGGDKIPDRTTGCVANITYGPAPDGFVITGIASN